MRWSLKLGIKVKLDVGWSQAVRIETRKKINGKKKVENGQGTKVESGFVDYKDLSRSENNKRLKWEQGKFLQDSENIIKTWSERNWELVHVISKLYSSDTEITVKAWSDF